MKNVTLRLATLATGALSVAACATSCTAKAQEPKRPNLLYIFPDQYRLHALGIWNDPEYRAFLSTVADPVHTPNIDKLAKSGLLFTQATSTHPVSSPHRAMLLSGMYPHLNGIEDINCKLDREQELHHDIECFTDVLYKAGYETAYIGKTHWHKTERLFDENGTFVNSLEAPGGHDVGLFDTYVPEGASRHGNKYWFQQLNDNHFNAIAYSNRPELIGGKKDGELYRPQEFTSKTEADVAIKFLRNQDGERDADSPFSIMWALNPPHPPYFRLSDCDSTIYNKYYRDLPTDELLVRDNYVSGAKAGDYTSSGDQKLEMNARIYFSLIKGIDHEIGRVLEVLEEIGEADNTIIVFTSDHGEMMGSHKLTGKNSIHDESFLVPFIIDYPGVIEHRTEDLLLGTVDIMPTMLSMMGLKDMIPATVMGQDYSQGLITGNFEGCEKPKTALYLRQDRKGVRSDRYTYVVTKKGEYELYDNLNDPYQVTSIELDSIPAEELKMLQSELGRWLKEAHDRWFDNKTSAKLVIYPEA